MSKPDRSIKDKPTPKIDPEAYRQRIDRLSAIFSDIAGHAEELSKFRCPYRDRLDRCTGKFKCRNQKVSPDDDLLVCLHDGQFDYRSAWETDPESYGRAKARIKKIKKVSAERRAPPSEISKKD
ncbi:MAG: hypothetical protein VCB60_01955 [Alphaproteobacteria bacterium]